MDRDTKKKMKKLLKKIDDFTKDLKPLRDKLSRSLGQQKRQKSQW
ncbi:hypothetical protein ACFL0P_07255 [Candidatus Omnitrophota bacterium]